MPHDYPLHTPVTPTCRCCRLRYRTTFTAPNDLVVCSHCTSHLRGTQEAMQKRNVDHVRMWQSFAEALDQERLRALQHAEEGDAALKRTIEERDATIEGLRADVNALNGEMQRVLEEAALGPAREPNEHVIKLLAGTVAEQAEVAKEQAYRMRNSAMGRLWAIDEVHHEDDEDRGRCVCKLSTDKCEVMHALAPIRSALYKWEVAEADRLERDLPHGLPPEHPKVQGRNRRRGLYRAG